MSTVFLLLIITFFLMLLIMLFNKKSGIEQFKCVPALYVRSDDDINIPYVPDPQTSNCISYNKTDCKRHKHDDDKCMWISDKFRAIPNLNSILNKKIHNDHSWCNRLDDKNRRLFRPNCVRKFLRKELRKLS